MKSSRSKHVANSITAARILGVGVLFWLTPFETNLWQNLTIVIYTLICLTDFLDGWVARKYKMVTDLGKILDPLADKILVLVFLPLLQMQVIGSFPVFIILAREFVVMAVRVFSAKQGVIIPASIWGKLKTAITFPVCGLLFARVDVDYVPQLPFLFKPLDTVCRWVYSWPQWSIDVLIWLVVTVTVLSLYDYLKDFLWQQVLQKTKGNPLRAKKQLKLLIPNSITFLNLCCGAVAALFAFFGLYHEAVLLVLIGTILDGLDGKLARKLNAHSQFGAKLDSKADYTNFGIAPSVVIFTLFKITVPSYGLYLGLAAGLTYYAAVHFRLRRFDKGGHSNYFEGLPSPIGAALVVVAAISPFLSQPIVFLSIILATSFLMISTIPYPHSDIIRTQKLLHYLQIPTFIFLVLTILQLLKLPFAKEWHVYEILFCFTCIYVLAPITQYFKEFLAKKQQ